MPQGDVERAEEGQNGPALLQSCVHNPFPRTCETTAYRGYHVPAGGVLHCGLQGSDNRVVLMPGEVVPLRFKARQGRCSKASMGDQSQPGGSVRLLPQSATSVPSTSSSTEGHISNSDSPATVPMTIVTGTIYPETP